MKKGFSLIELLVVMAIIALLAASTGPAISGLMGAGTVDKAIGDLSGTLKQARAYAMANNTYVRVVIGSAVPAGELQPKLVVVSLYSLDGTENVDPTAVSWPMISPPLLISNFQVTAQNAIAPDTSTDDMPSLNTYTTNTPISRTLPIVGNVAFTSCIEFFPSGEASIGFPTGTPAQVGLAPPSRFIKIAVDKPGSLSGKNPFILRLSGINGTVNILRKENM
jgi:prepilin-type N-terminal cleavage/methylation domain-containing protein